MAYKSPVPGALAYLTQLWAAAIAGAGLKTAQGETPEVHNGPDLPDTSARTALWVGWSGWASDLSQMDPTAAEVRVQFPPALAGQDRVGFTIHCAAQVLNGDADLAAAVADAYAIHDLAVGALAQARQLGGPAAGGLQVTAGESVGTLRRERVGTGVLATVQFDVEVDGFTNR